MMRRWIDLASGMLLSESSMSNGQHTFWEDIFLVGTRMESEFKSGTPSQPWKVIPAARLLAIFKSAAKTGVVRDQRGLQEIVSRMVENTMRLVINTEIAGHGNMSQADALRTYGIEEIEPEDVEQFVDWAIDTPTGWRISDYGLEALVKYACALLDDPPDEEKLSLISKMLNVTHQRSNLASWFVEGGIATLDRLEHE